MKVLCLKSCLLILVVTLFSSCSKDDSPSFELIDYSEENEATITKYITDNNLTATKSDTGLYYVINELGTGEHPTATDNVTVTYKGYFTDGTVFDQSTQEISFNLTQVIKGWTEGLQYFKEGGSGTLLIPAHLGYGNFPPSGIPKGAVLLFDIELISIN